MLVRGMKHLICFVKNRVHLYYHPWVQCSHRIFSGRIVGLEVCDGLSVLIILDLIDRCFADLHALHLLQLHFSVTSNSLNPSLIKPGVRFSRDRRQDKERKHQGSLRSDLL